MTFYQALNEVPWDAPFVFHDTDNVVDAWESLYNEAIDKHAPWRQKGIAHKH